MFISQAHKQPLIWLRLLTKVNNTYLGSNCLVLRAK